MKTKLPPIPLLKRVTSYPWGRDRRGDLVGAHGEAIYFMGADAVMVEHSPVLLETLVRINRITSSDRTAKRKLALIQTLVQKRIKMVDSQV